jgi:hypothetical protein
MNIPESRDFVVKHRPICCDQQVDTMGYNLTNSIQHFVCRGCGNKVDIKYWPLCEDDIRDLKLNSILQ